GLAWPTGQTSNTNAQELYSKRRRKQIEVRLRGLWLQGDTHHDLGIVFQLHALVGGIKRRPVDPVHRSRSQGHILDADHAGRPLIQLGTARNGGAVDFAAWHPRSTSGASNRFGPHVSDGRARNRDHYRWGDGLDDAADRERSGTLRLQ